jgi:hypothetical protein
VINNKACEIRDQQCRDEILLTETEALAVIDGHEDNREYAADV